MSAPHDEKVHHAQAPAAQLQRHVRTPHKVGKCARAAASHSPRAAADPPAACLHPPGCCVSRRVQAETPATSPATGLDAEGRSAVARFSPSLRRGPPPNTCTPVSKAQVHADAVRRWQTARQRALCREEKESAAGQKREKAAAATARMGAGAAAAERLGEGGRGGGEEVIACHTLPPPPDGPARALGRGRRAARGRGGGRRTPRRRGGGDKEFGLLLPQPLLFPRVNGLPLPRCASHTHNRFLLLR